MAVCIKDQIQNMNLVIGCTIGCSYCYARNNVRRFHMTEDFSRPEYFPGKLRLMSRKRPQNLLLTGMSEDRKSTRVAQKCGGKIVSESTSKKKGTDIIMKDYKYEIVL